jgi:hypothetical protein
MRKWFLLCATGTVIFFSSCKSIKNLTAKDNSRNTTSSKQSDNPEFLDDVSVTPGAKKPVAKKPATAEPVTKKKKYTPHTGNSSFDIEKASDLQFKYAPIVDVPVEELTNLLLLKNIDHWWGTKYCMGGSTEACTDCSSFTQAIMRDVYGISIPRTSEEQFNSSEPVEINDLREGDLVFFQTSSKNISHVGVYIANNKFAHASVSSGVMISDLDEDYWKQRYRGAGRVMK